MKLSMIKDINEYLNRVKIVTLEQIMKKLNMQVYKTAQRYLVVAQK